MSNRLANLLQNKNSTPLVWIEPGGYAIKAFAGGKAGWQAEAQSASSIMTQANSALASQVLSLDVAPALFLDAAPGAADDALATAEAILGSEPAVQRAVQVAQAVEHTLAGRVDIVLRLPSPAALLHRCGAPADAALDFDDMDDAAIALAGLVRRFSECKFSGLMLATDVSSDQTADEFDTFGAIASTAKHYRWTTLLRVDSDLDAAAAAQSKLDFVLLPNAAPTTFAKGWSAGDVRLGGGLSSAFWGGEDFEKIPDNALLYGDAPADISPEKVLQRAGSLPRG